MTIPNPTTGCTSAPNHVMKHSRKKSILLRAAVLSGGLIVGASALAQPIIHDVYPNGAVQLQATNVLGFGVTAGGADVNATGISVQLTSLNLAGQSQTANLTSGTGLSVSGTVGEWSVTTPIKTNILSYTAIIIATDVNGGSTTNTINFDTLSPAFTIEAEDYNHDNGQFIEPFVPGSYAGYGGVEGVDAHDNNINEGSTVYRYLGVDHAGAGMQTEGTGDKQRQAFIDVGAGDYNVGWTGGGEWGNYTRTFPAGVYNVYIRAARGNGGNGNATMAFVTSDPTQGGQTTSANLGTFVIPSTGNWQSYAWSPLTDGGGALAKVTLNGVQTVRFTTGDGYNVNYYAFFPANTNLPAIHDISPDGARLFQSANTMTFIASSSSGINPAAINVSLFATNLLGAAVNTNYTAANGLTIGGTAIDRTVSLPLQSNIMFYRAVISVTDLADNTVGATVNFNTLNPSYTVEAEDFDYNNGQFHDSPQTNAYAGSAGVDGVDAHHNPPGTSNGGPTGPYRTGGYNNENCGDSPRDQYVGTGLADYNLGWNDGGFWANYTRTYPAGTYNVYMRAGNGTGGNGSATFAQVISGVGTPTQTLTNLGTFTIPQTGGWQTYTWVPLKDAGGNLVAISGGAVKTFRITAGGSYNPNFYAFFPADTSLPVIDQISPDGTAPFQYTNTFRFRASSSAGIATGNITVNVDGVNVTGLNFTGSATSWNVSYANLAVNMPHTIIITVLANNGSSKSTTVSFDTFQASYYQFEAEDYDYGGGLFVPDPQVNGYQGLAPVADVDYHDVAVGGGADYRGVAGNDTITDLPRTQFIGHTDYNLGFFENGEWVNFTRNFPLGTYQVWLRSATGNGSTTTATLDKVISGQGTTTQTTAPLGSFSIPNNGWGAFGWQQLKDANNQPAVVIIDGFPNTLRLGRPVATPGANVNFAMLVPVLAPTQIQIVRAGNNNAISFPGQTGFSYQVQYKNNLSDPTWTNVGSVIAGNNTVQTVNDTSAGGSRFYRAVISQP